MSSSSTGSKHPKALFPATSASASSAATHWRCNPGLPSSRCSPMTDEKWKESLGSKSGFPRIYPSEEECQKSCPSLPEDVITSIAYFLNPAEVANLSTSSGTLREMTSKDVMKNFFEYQLLNQDIDTLFTLHGNQTKFVNRLCEMVRRGYGKMFSSSILLNLSQWLYEPMRNRDTVLNVFALILCMLKSGWNIPSQDKPFFVSEIISQPVLKATAMSQLRSLGFFDNLLPKDAGAILSILYTIDRVESIDWTPGGMIDYMLKKIDPDHTLNERDPEFMTYLWSMEDSNNWPETFIDKKLHFYQLLDENGLHLSTGVKTAPDESKSSYLGAIGSVLKLTPINTFGILKELADNVEYYRETGKLDTLAHLLVILLKQPYYRTKEGERSIIDNYETLNKYLDMDKIFQPWRPVCSGLPCR